jgi:outer membrane biogenesis lipoprotein LolB
MRTIKIVTFALSFALFTACGGSTQKSDTHTHDDGCTQTHDSSTHNETPQQESFTVEADSTHSHGADSCSTKAMKPHTHSHDDGKPHTH